MKKTRRITALIVIMIGALYMVQAASSPGMRGKRRRDGTTKERRYFRNKNSEGREAPKVASSTGTATEQQSQNASSQMHAQTPKAEHTPTYTVELQQKAEAGDIAAQLNLALCYDIGSGIEKNPVEAHKWFLKAAEQGNGRAMNAVGNYYKYGTGGVEKDLETAITWYRKSAEQGNDRGQYSLGVCYANGTGVEKDLTEAVKWYRKSAEQGNVNAQYALGWCYAQGQGVEKDLAEAVKWYLKSAEQGNAYAQFTIGRYYLLGRGVEKNLVEAVKWFRKSAEQGDADAQYAFGQCYSQGWGVKKDFVEAVKWFHKSAEQGNADAQLAIGLYYDLGRGVEKNRVEAVKWFRKSAEQGNADAQLMLGSSYFNGIGVKEDIEEAFKWLSKSAKQGNENAKEMLGKPEFSLVRVVRGSSDDIEAGENCLRKLKEIKKEGRFNVETHAPMDMLAVKGLYIGMPVDDAVVACGKIAVTSDDYLVVDSRMLKEEKWSQYKVLKEKMKGCDGVCVFSCKGTKTFQDAIRLCVVRLDGHGHVRQIFFTQTGMDEIFKARKLTTEEFATALVDNYQKLPSLSKKVNDKKQNGADIREYRWTYTTSDYNVELYENTIIVEGREISLREYKAIMANDPNALGVAFGESLFDKYFCIDANAKKAGGTFD